MPWPWSSGPKRTGGARLDGWLPAGAWRLEHHAIELPVEPAEALAAIEGVRLRDVPVVGALFSLRRLEFQRDMTIGQFFATAPFLHLEEEPGRELAFGVVEPPRGRAGASALRPPRTPPEFRAAVDHGWLAAIGNFRADPVAGGSRLWTETWVFAPTPGQRATFVAYWLLIGPFSAWIRRLLLRAAARRIVPAPGGPAPSSRDR